MTKLHCVVFLAVLDLHVVGLAKDRPILISTTTDESQPTSVEMMKLFRQKIAEHDTLFKLVGNDDASAGIIFQAECMAKDALYVCFYTLFYTGGTHNTLMGGGVNAAKTANEIADGFLTSIAQDIVEGMNRTVRTNAVENLEACLFLTQSSCAVPEDLAPELRVKTLNLSQYLQKGGLNKTKHGLTLQK